MSSSINALAAVTVEDLVKPHFTSLSERSLSWISQGLSKFSFHNSILTLGDDFLEISKILSYKCYTVRTSERECVCIQPVN